MPRHAAVICLSGLILGWSSAHLSAQTDAERVRNVVRAKTPDFSGTVLVSTNTVLYRVVEAGVTIVVLSNTDKSNVDALAFEISRVLLGTSKAANF